MCSRIAHTCVRLPPFPTYHHLLLTSPTPGFHPLQEQRVQYCLWVDSAIDKLEMQKSGRASQLFQLDAAPAGLEHVRREVLPVQQVIVRTAPSRTQLASII